uniref:Gustatory receptor n=1 Tax=Anopheles stephensi TaxID=30069 RepID=A0A182YDG3_ANOST
MAQLCAHLRVLFFVGNLFHLLPCRYNSKTDQFESNSKLSQLAFVINLSLCSLQLCFDWFHVWHGDRNRMSRIFNFLLLLHIVSFPMTIVYMQLLSYTKRARIAILHSELFTDRSWRLFGERTDSWYVSSLWLGRFTTTVTIGGVVYLFPLIVTGKESITRIPIYATFFEAVRLYMTLVAILIYVVCVLVIKMRFKQIQERVEQFSPSLNTDRQWRMFLDHYQLGVSLVNEINDNFSVLLMMILVLVQVQLSNQAFVLYCSTQVVNSPAVSVAITVHTQMWESSFLLMLLLVGYACESCHEQIDSVNVAIRNYTGADIGAARTVQEWKRLDQFHLQTLYQKHRQRFTVGGLFVLDNKLVCMALTSMVTYLVILIQFRQLDEEDLLITFGNVSELSF